MITFRRLGIATALALTITAAPAAPVGAATTSVSGMFVLDTETDSTCGKPPAGYEEFDELTFVISGDLDGCWYTNIGRGWDLGPPSGLYFEVGRELFVGGSAVAPRDLHDDLHVRIPMGPRLSRPAARRSGDGAST